jgi:DNA-binding response OmpR family regulator
VIGGGVQQRPRAHTGLIRCAEDAIVRVLVIEEESKLTPLLEQQGQHAVVSSDRETVPGTGEFDAVVIDSRLTFRASLLLCRNIRSHQDVVPVVMITDEDSLESRIEAFEAGADACLSGTLVFEELLARLRAFVRRSQISSG